MSGRLRNICLEDLRRVIVNRGGKEERINVDDDDNDSNNPYVQ